MPWSITGFSLPHGPHVVLHPNMGPTLATLRPKFPSPRDVTIGEGSTVVLEGEGLVVERLEVNGALIVKACPGARVGEALLLLV